LANRISWTLPDNGRDGALRRPQKVATSDPWNLDQTCPAYTTHADAAARRPYHVLWSDHHAHIVAEIFEAIQDPVHGVGLERNGCDDAMRQIKLPRARQIQEQRNLAR